MRDERNLFRRDVGLVQESIDAGHDTGRHAFRGIVTGRNFHARNDDPGRGVDRDNVGKRATNVDP